MDEKKKRKFDTVPEIYMSGTDNRSFFEPNYPFESNECTKDIIPNDESTLSTDSEASDDGDYDLHTTCK